MSRERTTILTVDDEPSILKFLRANLEANGFRTLVAKDGAEALHAIEKELPDLVILDIVMPKVDGFEVARKLREWSQIPIIMLSARGSEEDKVKCLNLGADDYLCKPFGIKELLARVRAVLRRTEAAGTGGSEAVFRHQNLEVNFTKRRVIVAGREVKLTPTEYSLLRELVLNSNKVLTHHYLLGRVWGPEYGGEKEYLRVFVNRLRKQLREYGKNPGYIATIPGVGYQLKTS